MFGHKLNYYSKLNSNLISRIEFDFTHRITYSLHCVIQRVKEIELLSVETVSQKSNKNQLCETKNVIKMKSEFKKTIPDLQFEEFSLTKQKTRPSMDYHWIGKTI